MTLCPLILSLSKDWAPVTQALAAKFRAPFDKLRVSGLWAIGNLFSESNATFIDFDHLACLKFVFSIILDNKGSKSLFSRLLTPLSFTDGTD